MSEKLRQMLSHLMTGVLGGVIAIVVLALLAIGPLQARDNRWNPFARPVPPVCVTGNPPPMDACLSNEKQLGRALQQYVQDNDDTYPSGTQPAVTASGRMNTGVGWGGQLHSYLMGSVTDYTCPMDPTQAVKPAVVVSYALNKDVEALNSASTVSPDQSVAMFEVGGDTAQVRRKDEGASAGATEFSAASDGTDGNLVAGLHGGVVPATYYATGYLGGRPVLSTGSQFESATPRDNAYFTNILFLDGHAKPTIPAMISTGENAVFSTDAQTGGVTGTAAGTFYVGSNTTVYTATFSLR